MRQVMPHRNNIGVEAPACKRFLGWLRPLGPQWREGRDPPETALVFRLRITPIESVDYVSVLVQRSLKPHVPGIAVMPERHISRSF
jgi:hypothetical protein